MKTEVKLHKAILHVLDTQVTVPVISTCELELDESMTTYIEKHLQKALDDGNIQEALFLGESSILHGFQSFKAEEMKFLEFSTVLASELFNIMVKQPEIPPADLLICTFSTESSRYLGILKMNYRTGYSHFVIQGEAGPENSLILQRALLPTEGQKVDECAFLSLDDYGIRLIQKDYLIDGEKREYWSQDFLRCESKLSTNARFKILDKAAKKITQKYYEEDFTKVAELRKTVAETLEDNRGLEVDAIAHAVFKEDEILRKEYIGEVEKAGIQEKRITVPEHLVSKGTRNQKIKTDSGIEINFPPQYYNDKSKLEFINNLDGTISIVIKNVGRIENR